MHPSNHAKTITRKNVYTKIVIPLWVRRLETPHASRLLPMGLRADTEPITQPLRQTTPSTVRVFRRRRRIRRRLFAHAAQRRDPLLHAGVAHPAGVQRPVEVVAESAPVTARGIRRAFARTLGWSVGRVGFILLRLTLGLRGIQIDPAVVSLDLWMIDHERMGRRGLTRGDRFQKHSPTTGQYTRGGICGGMAARADPDL